MVIKKNYRDINRFQKFYLSISRKIDVKIAVNEKNHINYVHFFF